MIRKSTTWVCINLGEPINLPLNHSGGEETNLRANKQKTLPLMESVCPADFFFFNYSLLFCTLLTKITNTQHYLLQQKKKLYTILDFNVKGVLLSNITKPFVSIRRLAHVLKAKELIVRGDHWKIFMK